MPHWQESTVCDAFLSVSTVCVFLSGNFSKHICSSHITVDSVFHLTVDDSWPSWRVVIIIDFKLSMKCIGIVAIVQWYEPALWGMTPCCYVWFQLGLWTMIETLMIRPCVRIFRGSISDTFRFMNDNTCDEQLLYRTSWQRGYAISRLFIRIPVLKSNWKCLWFLGQCFAIGQQPPKNKDILIGVLKVEWKNLLRQL